MSNYITIPLSKTGKHAGKHETIVDYIDSDLADFDWSVTEIAVGRNIYAIRSVYDGSRKPIARLRLHRVILERVLGYPIPADLQVDHINGNSLDNRRENLRVATPSQNNFNRGKHRDNKSGFKGVAWSKSANKWQSRITFDGKRIHLGYFDTPESASDAYGEAILKYHGKFGRK